MAGGDVLRRVPGGEVLQVLARVELDWSDPTHRAVKQAACRICGSPTFERDGQDLPADKACLEAELAAERAGLSRPPAADGRLRMQPQVTNGK